MPADRNIWNLSLIHIFYSLGAINFTGDEPVIITCDGPSLGGFVCQAVVPEAELWKVGQVKPGDSIQFVPLSYESSRSLKESQDVAIESLDGSKLKRLDSVSAPVSYTHLDVYKRQLLGRHQSLLEVLYQLH